MLQEEGPRFRFLCPWGRAMAEALRVLVVDDEAPARSKLKRMLGVDIRFQQVGEAVDGLQAVEKVRSLQPDLLILDIQMPGLTGFEVLEALEPPLPQVIFSTAYDEYALDAFEASAVDYLLKPYDEARFTRALDRVFAMHGFGRGHELKALLSKLAKAPLERLLVKTDDRWIPLQLRQVWRLSADGKQVKVYAESGIHAVRKSLVDLERRLDPRRFIRVHRSEIIALDCIAHLEPWDHSDALLVLKDGSHVVLSRTHKAAFLARWGLEV
jgi:two-component system, LytTR family, response regulator